MKPICQPEQKEVRVSVAFTCVKFWHKMTEGTEKHQVGGEIVMTGYHW